MLEETGVVVEQIRPGRVRIKVTRSTACDCCASSAVCQALTGQDEMLVEACDGVGVQPGQKVVIAIREKTLLWASFLIYILPLAGMIMGVSLTRWLAPPAFQAWEIAGGFLGLALGFLGIYHYSRRLKKAEYLPTVVRVA
jgi:sigma-E factor negative regulatory protein RseC